MRVITKCVLDIETMDWIYIEAHNYEGPVALACPGASSGMQAEAAQESDLGYNLSQDFAHRYADQTQTLDKLNNVIMNISQGKLAPGFDAATRAAMSSQAINAATANAKNITQAVNAQNAGRGGTSGLDPFFASAEKATALTGVANQEAQQQQNIVLANQQAAERNTAMELGGLGQLGGLQNPEGYAGLAGKTIGEAYSQQKQNAQARAQNFATIAGGIGSLAGAAMDFIPGGKILKGVKGLFGGGSGAGAPDYAMPGSSAAGLGIDTTEPDFSDQLSQ